MNFLINGKMDLRILSRGGFNVDSYVSRDIKGTFYVTGSIADMIASIRAQVLTLLWDRIGLIRGSGVSDVKLNANWVFHISPNYRGALGEEVTFKVDSSDIFVEEMMNYLKERFLEFVCEWLKERELTIRGNIREYNLELTDIEDTLCRLERHATPKTETTEEDVPF